MQPGAPANVLVVLLIANSRSCAPFRGVTVLLFEELPAPPLNAMPPDGIGLPCMSITKNATSPDCDGTNSTANCPRPRACATSHRPPAKAIT